jgi:hypothetical protein
LCRDPVCPWRPRSEYRSVGFRPSRRGGDRRRASRSRIDHLARCRLARRRRTHRHRRSHEHPRQHGDPHDPRVSDDRGGRLRDRAHRSPRGVHHPRRRSGVVRGSGAAQGRRSQRGDRCGQRRRPQRHHRSCRCTRSRCSRDDQGRSRPSGRDRLRRGGVRRQGQALRPRDASSRLTMFRHDESPSVWSSGVTSMVATWGR